MAQTDWWVIVPLAELKAPTRPADAKVVSTVEGTAEDTAYLEYQAVNGWTAYMGPFTTQAAAQTAQVDPNANTTLAGIKAGSAVGGIPNPLTGLAAVGDFFARLTQANTWIRLVEGILGLGLLVVGLAKMSGTGSTLRKAVKIT